MFYLGIHKRKKSIEVPVNGHIGENYFGKKQSWNFLRETIDGFEKSVKKLSVAHVQADKNIVT